MHIAFVVFLLILFFLLIIYLYKIIKSIIIYFFLKNQLKETENKLKDSYINKIKKITSNSLGFDELSMLKSEFENIEIKTKTDLGEKTYIRLRNIFKVN